MFIDFNQFFQALSSRDHLNSEPKDFMSSYYKKFPAAVLGCTYRPESMGSQEAAIDGLDDLKKLGIQEVRLGLRWNKIEKSPNKLNLSYYEPIIEKLLKQKAKISLNIGPIKSAGWPEQFIPDWVSNECTIRKGQCIHVGDDIAIRALDYTDRLLKTLHHKYGEDAFTSIQPENESFKKFGTLQTTSGKDYLNELIRLVDLYYPKIPILLNSAGRSNIYQIFQFIKKYGNHKKFIVGYNYYFVTDTNYKFYPGVRYFDDFVRMKFTSPPMNLVPPQVKFEVSECQFEKWGRAMWPGDSYEAFCYALWRSGQAIPAGQDEFVIRLWGVEKLIKKIRSHKLTEEHDKIISAIQMLSKSNSQLGGRQKWFF